MKNLDINRLSWQHLVLLLLVLIVLYYTYNTIRGAIKKFKNDKEEKKRLQEIEELAQKPGNRPSHPILSYTAWADILETAMQDESWNTGTDEEAIFSVYRKMQTIGDIIELEKAFGTRAKTPVTFGGSFAKWFASEMNLPQWLTDELTKDEIKKLNAILQKNGVNYSY